MTFYWLDVCLQGMVVGAGCCGGGVCLVHYLGKQVWFLRLIGVDVLSLSQSELDGLSDKIKQAINDYVTDYVLGDSCTFNLPLYALHEQFAHVVSDEYIMTFLDTFVVLDERIELFEVIEGHLVLEINREVLQTSYANKVLRWKCEGHVERIAYHEGKVNL